MSIEVAPYSADLDDSNPAGGDVRTEGAAHLRLIKTAVKASWPNVNAVVTPTDESMNKVAGFDTAVASALLAADANGIPSSAFGHKVSYLGNGPLERTLDFSAAQGCLLTVNSYTTGIVTLAGLVAGRFYSARFRNSFGVDYPITWSMPGGWTLFRYPLAGLTATSGSDYLVNGSNRYDFFVVNSSRVVMFAYNSVNMV